MDSLKKRYLSKFLANLFSSAIGLIIQAIVPRGLGPQQYGAFNFLSNFFTQLVSLGEMGSSYAFYTKLSRRPGEYPLVIFYTYFFCLVSLLILAVAIIAQAMEINHWLWPSQGMFFVYLAAFFAIMTWLVDILNKIVDARGLTVYAELSRIIQKIIAVALIGVLYVFHRLDLTNYFFYQYAILLFLVVAFLWVLIKEEKTKQGTTPEISWRMPTVQMQAYWREFYEYTYPLLIFSIVGFVANVLDRWLLQIFGGDIQQGFYGLSYQIGALCFLFTTAMTPLLIREFSIAYGNNDLGAMSALFARYVPLLYAVSAYFACFVAVQAKNVTLLMGGRDFHQATAAVTIMAFYPIHQTYGQLSDSVMLATDQTRLYRNIGIIFMIVGVAATFFLIAPRELMGLNAGAMGLAVKMISIQFIIVNIRLYYNSRYLRISFWRYFLQQLLCVACLVVLAGAATLMADGIYVGEASPLGNFLFAGFLYSGLVALSLYLLPPLFGLRRGDFRMLLEKIKPAH